MMRNNTTVDKSCRKRWKENRQTRTVPSVGFLCCKTPARDGGFPEISRFFSAESRRGSEVSSTGTLKEVARKTTKDKAESLWRKHLTRPDPPSHYHGKYAFWRA